MSSVQNPQRRPFKIARDKVVNLLKKEVAAAPWLCLEIKPVETSNMLLVVDFEIDLHLCTETNFILGSIVKNIMTPAFIKDELENWTLSYTLNTEDRAGGFITRLTVLYKVD